MIQISAKAGKSVSFITLANLIGGLAKAEREGTLRERFQFYSRLSLLIVNEFVLRKGGDDLHFAPQ